MQQVQAAGRWSLEAFLTEQWAMQHEATRPLASIEGCSLHNHPGKPSKALYLGFAAPGPWRLHLFASFAAKDYYLHLFTYWPSGLHPTYTGFNRPYLNLQLHTQYNLKDSVQAQRLRRDSMGNKVEVEWYLVGILSSSRHQPPILEILPERERESGKKRHCNVNCQEISMDGMVMCDTHCIHNS